MRRLIIYCLLLASAAAFADADQVEKQWGVSIKDRANCYDEDGKRISTIPSGSVVDIIRVKNADGNRIAVCKPLLGTTLKDIFYISVDDITIYNGDYRKLDHLELARLLAEAEIQGRIEKEVNRLVDAEKQKNPHLVEYGKCREAAKDYFKKVRELNEQVIYTKGELQEEAAGELMLMKKNEVGEKLDENLKAAEKKVVDWYEANPVDRSKVNSARLTQYREQLQELRKQLKK